MGKLSSAHNTAVLSWKSHKVSGFADLNTLKRVDWSDSIEFLRCRHEKIPFKYRDPRISEALAELSSVPPSVLAFVEFHITLYRLGIAGVECSQDLLCEHIKRICHASRFGARTLRSAARWAVEHGYIDQSWLAIGKRVQMACGEYRTLKIRRYASTYKIRLLCSILREDPAKYQAAELHTAEKNPHYLTLEKRSDNPSGELPNPGSFDDPGFGKLLRLDVVKDDRQATRNERTAEGKHEESATSADESAAFNGKGRSADRSDTSADRPLAARRSDRPKVKAGRVSTRRSVLTYEKARRSFLHELFVCLKPGSEFEKEPGAAELYNIASVQTEIFYPEVLPAALDWFDFLTETFFKNWHDRRRDIERIALPALRIFLNQWTMPEKDPAAESRSAFAFEKWERSLLPDPPVWLDRALVPDLIRRWSFARFTLSGLWAGRFDWSNETMISSGPLARFCDLYCAKHADII